jgi:hypothetical protein
MTEKGARRAPLEIPLILLVPCCMRRPWDLGLRQVGSNRGPHCRLDSNVLLIRCELVRFAGFANGLSKVVWSAPLSDQESLLASCSHTSLSD